MLRCGGDFRFEKSLEISRCHVHDIEQNSGKQSANGFMSAVAGNSEVFDGDEAAKLIKYSQGISPTEANGKLASYTSLQAKEVRLCRREKAELSGFDFA